MNIKQLIITLFLILIIIPIVFAVEIPFIDSEKIDQTVEILEQEFKEITESTNPDEVVMIVDGEQISGLETVFINYLEKKYPFFETSTHVLDKAVNIDELMKTQKTIVLLGGITQNKITESLYNQGLLSEKEHPSKNFLALFEGKNNAGSKIIVLSDRRGFENMARIGPSRSPLTKYMSPEAVIATASFLSVFLAALWSYISGPIRIFLAKIITGMKKKKIKVLTEAKSINIGKFQLKYREIISIIFGLIVYSTGVTLAVTGLGFPIFDVLKINLIGAVVFFSVREIGRLIMSYKMDLHTEYVFWLPGAIFALFSGFLGNTLNTPGFVIEHTDKEIKFNRYAFIKYIIVIGTFAISLIFLILNILKPSIGIQLFGLISSTYAAIEIIPIKPNPGKDIMKWKPILWFFSFIVIFSSYIFFNFIV